MLDQAAKLRDIAGDLHAHVNLIPYNTVEGLPWKCPSLTRQQNFMAVLQERGVSVTLRREKGRDIDAACGQLRLKTERDRAASPAA
jgi:23S rRNA (adenine2503-C2)-methyltransferase